MLYWLKLLLLVVLIIGLTLAYLLGEHELVNAMLVLAVGYLGLLIGWRMLKSKRLCELSAPAARSTLGRAASAAFHSRHRPHSINQSVLYRG
jgi:hypothetical protein